MRYLAARLRTEKGKFLHVTELEMYGETDTRGTVVKAGKSAFTRDSEDNSRRTKLSVINAHLNELKVFSANVHEVVFSIRML